MIDQNKNPEIKHYEVRKNVTKSILKNVKLGKKIYKI